MKFRVELEYDFEYEGYVAECPMLPGCMSQGKTKKEVLKNIQEAIFGYLKVVKKKHRRIPAEERHPIYVDVPVSITGT
ncbi:type II toxin-antitoxin system HicB family antitoxin [bacterium]|nr:type II toxin-antitoxin system HicB family antitoxin [bacterium]MBU4310362.1 type II toxin-antitoxin system HicB family antitoxin [bacterium]MBU4561486.1 type II toxin-antitoxin system HicB family antitoxin [bacterium]MCG2676311.1 type II toxin-antitoxin system HicB family antitoxin [bacterium]MCG2677648.1 type II toxin-antitoxin system HicB family antitoxin [bacterium]